MSFISKKADGPERIGVEPVVFGVDLQADEVTKLILLYLIKVSFHSLANRGRNIAFDGELMLQQ